MAVAAEKVKSAQVLKSYAAETKARVQEQREKVSQHADIVVPAQVEKAKIETLAEADAEKTSASKR